MMENVVKVECPKCFKKTFKLIGCEDFGDYWNPPSFDFDIEHSCQCEFTDAEWDKVYENFLRLFEIEEQIGNLEHGLVELECRMSDESYPEKELERFMEYHEKDSQKIKELEEKHAGIKKEIYGEDI